MGWGRQTWTLAAMMALGELPKAEIVHSDTSHEMEGTYAFRRQWEPWLREHGLTVTAVRPTNADVVVAGTGIQTSVRIPAFTLNTTTAAQGRVTRGCTSDWKIMPIRRYCRQRLLEMGRSAEPGAVKSIQGISYDEWSRMHDSDVAYITHSYPLVDMRMTLADCLAWLDRHGLPAPPKSSCYMCPFHSTAAWKRIKQDGGEDWLNAVAVDESIRREYSQKEEPVELYLHRSTQPLDQAIRIPEDYGAKQSTMFNGAEECDGGYCHV